MWIQNSEKKMEVLVLWPRISVTPLCWCNNVIKQMRSTESGLVLELNLTSPSKKNNSSICLFRAIGLIRL